MCLPALYDVLLVHFLQFNGTSTNGLADFDLTSGDQAARSSHNSSLRSGSHYSHQSHTETTTQPLEAKTLPPEIANTLEHIVGQLDILTQVCEHCFGHIFRIFLLIASKVLKETLHGRGVFRVVFLC